jgi:hypothetical protein
VLEERPAHRQIRIATFDVTALYPSIDLNNGISSLRWFLKTFCDYSVELNALILVLARFVFTHCYIACPDVNDNIFHQLIGTAVGTIFAVVYAKIHMILVETDAVERFRDNITLYKRFIDYRI